jgi:TonB family protein
MKLRVNSGISVCLAFLSQFALSPILSASESPLASMGSGSGSGNDALVFLTSDTNALDSNGGRHRGIEYGRKERPWIRDVIKAGAPNYPYPDRILHHRGIGFFQISLDLKAGSVTKVTVLKSTGFPALDNSVVGALRQWRWKPGKWKEIEIAIGFTTALAGRLCPPGSIRLAPAPAKWRRGALP